LRIDPEVELSRGRAVADFVTASHDDQLRDLGEDARLHSDRRGDIREWPDRHEDDVAVRRQVGLDEPLYSVAVLLLGAGRWQIEIVPVDDAGAGALEIGPYHGLGHTLEDGNVNPDVIEDPKRILCTDPDTAVAVDSRRADQFDLG